MTKLFSILGDSISTFENIMPRGWRVYYAGELRQTTGVKDVHDTWWMRVIDHYKGRLLANASFSGSWVEGSGFPAGSSDERVCALRGMRRGGRGGLATYQDPEVILINIGINDYGWGGADAQACAHGNALPAFEQVRQQNPLVVPSAVDKSALARFGKAYTTMLEKIRHEYPCAHVWCLTLLPGRMRGESNSTFTYNLRGADIDLYNEAIRQAAQQTGCKVADIAAFGLEYEASDGTHPTSLGMRQIASMVIAAMEGEAHNSNPANWPVPLATKDAWKAVRPCEDGVCVQCAKRVSTANPWYLVCGGQIRSSHPEFDPYL